MEFILTIVAIFLAFQYVNYQIESKDKSLQGFIEHMKHKYYNKNND